MEHQHQQPQTEAATSDEIDSIVDSFSHVSASDEVMHFKITHETMIRDARERKLTHKEILDDVQQQVKAYPAFTMKAIYRKPVAGHYEGKTYVVDEWAMGLSIRAAEAIAVAMGFNSAEIKVRDLDANTSQVTAEFMDFARGLRRVMSSSVSRVYSKSKRRGGGTARYRQDEFDNRCRSEGSKLLRNAITRACPPGLAMQLQEIIVEEQRNVITPERIERLVHEFKRFDVTREDLDAWVKANRNIDSITKIDGEDRIALVQIYQSLREGTSKPEEIFGQLDGGGGGDRSTAANLAAQVPTDADPVDTGGGDVQSGSAPSGGETGGDDLFD